tara:strand:+ start:4319 stop:4597 length:279 start_codon:yes stop_codon:yes gene_type:complete
MWRDCGVWQTGVFRGYPEFSQQTFAHVYEHASDELLVWVRDNGTGTGVRWLHDLGCYVRHRSKAEGRFCWLAEYLASVHPEWTQQNRLPTTK